MLELKKIELFSKLKEDQLKEIQADMHIHHYSNFSKPDCSWHKLSHGWKLQG